jgi:type I restriction enzyme M protein
LRHVTSWETSRASSGNASTEGAALTSSAAPASRARRRLSGNASTEGEKRSDDPDETQPAAFVYESRYIGLDDVVPKTRASVAAQARELAEKEMEEVVVAFSDYLAGKAGPWLVPADRLVDRLDAKYLLPWSVSALAKDWESEGVDSALLEELVEPVEDHASLDASKLYTFLRISYEGRAERGEQARGEEVSYTRVGRTQPGDIVVSNINAVNRAICVVPEAMGDLLVSHEFTVLRLKPDAKADPLYLWSVLRSSAVAAEWMSGSSGVGRHRVDWELLRKQRVPLLPIDEQRRVGDLLREAHEREAEIERLHESAATALDTLGLEGEAPRERLLRAKPPR